MSLQKKALFIISALLLIAIAFLLLKSEKDAKVEHHLQTRTKQYLQSYDVIYTNYAELSSVIFQTKINTQEVKAIFQDAFHASDQQKSRIRARLLEHIGETYKLLKEYNIKQLHFHLPNNESFLRLHRPAKYGDDLTHVRETIRYVNEEKKAIDGFEEGRIFNGYRFVLPLRHENRHIGSVEVSFSTLAMSMKFMQSFNVSANFLISKEVVDEKVFSEEKSNYVPSLYEGFVVEKKLYESIIERGHKNINAKVSKKTHKALKHHLKAQRSFSVYDRVKEKILTFQMVKNPVTHKVVAVFVVESAPVYIINKTRNFYFILASVVAIILLSLTFLYRLLHEKDMLNEMVTEKTTELRELNENLEEKVKERTLALESAHQKIVESEKMAALGQLISGVAHEINTPLGAINSSAENITNALQHLLGRFYKTAHAIEDAAAQDTFVSIITEPAQKRKLSFKEKRAKKKEVESVLNERGIAYDRKLVDIIINNGLSDKIETLLPFMQLDNYQDIIGTIDKAYIVRANAENIQDAITKISKIIFALKNYARKDHSGEMSMERLEDRLEDVVVLHQNALKQGVEVVREYEDLAPIACFHDQLAQVWSNMIQNAIHAMNYHGTLTLKVYQDDHYQVVQISDTGSGIPLEIQDKIFQPLFTTKAHGEGTGLGLDIAKKMVTLHKGEIKVDSAMGKGTTFTIYLPMMQD
jgi:signal transduction histidine kinase